MFLNIAKNDEIKTKSQFTATAPGTANFVNLIMTSTVQPRKDGKIERCGVVC